MQPAGADGYFGQVLHGAARGTRLARAQALKACFLFLELRHKAEIHQMTGHVVECPVDEINRPRGSQDAALRIPPAKHRPGCCSPGGAASWRDAASSPRPRGRVTPHLLRHFCASQLYAHGMDLVAIQEVLGHSWIITTMNYIHVRRTHVEDAWLSGQQRAAGKLKGLLP